jgi:hypothetical protein
MVMLAPMLGSMTANAQSYRYVRWVGLERLTIEQPVGQAAQGRIVVGNDAFLQTDFCEAEADYYCFFSTHEAFAVPKMLDSSSSEWTVRGVRFELVARDLTVSILGRRVGNLFMIRSPADATATGGKPWLYLYSARDGLVAFGSEDLRATYWLEGEVGFGGSHGTAASRITERNDGSMAATQD